MNLRDINPKAVGVLAARMLLDSIAQNTSLPSGVSFERSDDGWELRVDGHVHVIPLETSLDAVSDLCSWAQSGRLCGWHDIDDVARSVATTSQALCAAPARVWTLGGLADLMGGQEAPENDVVLVLGCAWARVRICRGEAVTLTELARLASVDPSRVRQIVADGELETVAGRGPNPSTVTAAEAKRWLSGRALRGWDDAADALVDRVESIRSGKGTGYAPRAIDAIAAARDGFLWAVDSRDDGEGTLIITDSAESALEEVAESVGRSLSEVEERGWTAQRIGL